MVWVLSSDHVTELHSNCVARVNRPVRIDRPAVFLGFRESVANDRRRAATSAKVAIHPTGDQVHAFVIARHLEFIKCACQVVSAPSAYAIPPIGPGAPVGLVSVIRWRAAYAPAPVGPSESVPPMCRRFTRQAIGCPIARITVRSCRMSFRVSPIRSRAGTCVRRLSVRASPQAPWPAPGG